MKYGGNMNFKTIKVLVTWDCIQTPPNSITWYFICLCFSKQPMSVLRSATSMQFGPLSNTINRCSIDLTRSPCWQLRYFKTYLALDCSCLHQILTPSLSPNLLKSKHTDTIHFFFKLLNFLRIVTFLSFLSYQSNPVTLVCTSTFTLQTGAANSTFLCTCKCCTHGFSINLNTEHKQERWEEEKVRQTWIHWLDCDSLEEALVCSVTLQMAPIVQIRLISERCTVAVDYKRTI